MTPQSATIEQAPARGEHAGGYEGGRTRRRRAARRGAGLIKLLAFLLVVGGAAGGAYAYLGKEKATAKLHEGIQLAKEQLTGPPRPPRLPDRPEKPRGPWNGLVEVDEAGRRAIGFRLVEVLPQTEPMRLPIPGTTDYDQTTLVRIRPRFDNALVDKVFVTVGQAVRKGEPLLEIKSSDLAQAKTDCQTKFVQWDHDHKFLIGREPLAKEGRITQIVWTDTQNDEKKSRLDYLVSRQKLASYGIANDEVSKLLEGLGDDLKKAQEADDNTQDISRMTVSSPIDGVVVKFEVVPGNFYDQANILLTLSPMDKIWVLGNVFESDQDKVHIGQKWDVLFPFSNETFEAKVEQIDSGVDPETRTLQIRASIPNPAKHLRARMQAKATLQVDPLPGDTVIPRNAMLVINGEYFAFVRRGAEGKGADQFERRKLEIEQENSDHAVVRSGLKAGETVVSNGSLILGQMYEDLGTIDSGMPTR